MRARSDVALTLIRKEMSELGITTAKQAIRIAAAPTEDSRRRATACSLLGTLQSRTAVPMLLRIAIQEDDPLVAWDAISALAAIGGRKATKPLMTILMTSQSILKRQAAAHSLWFLGDWRARNLQLRLMQDAHEDERIRAFAAEGLGCQRPTMRIVRALISTLDDPSVLVRISAICGLGGLAGWISAGGSGMRPAARRLFRRLVVPALRSRLDDTAFIPGEETAGEFAANALDNI